MFESPCSLAKHPNPILRLVAIEAKALCLMLCDRLIVLSLVHDGCGANSTQIGILFGVVVINAFSALTRSRVVASTMPRQLLSVGLGFRVNEGCLSLDGASALKTRLKPLVVVWVNAVTTRVCASKSVGVLAACWQHELDHSRGVLIAD
ncbi:peptide deformylase [Candidatus Hodgkinia cicadicola]